MRCSRTLRRFALRLGQSLRPGSRDAESLRVRSPRIWRSCSRNSSGRAWPPRRRYAPRAPGSGGIRPTAEQHRDARAFRWLIDARQDLRYAVRMLRRAPGFSAVAVCSLALGIGANTILFSVLDSFLFRTLPVPAADRLVNVREIWPGGRVRTEAPYWEFTAMRDALPDVLKIAAVAVFDRSNIAVGGATEAAAVDSGPARVALVSGNYFPVLQAAAEVGRTLTEEDDRVRDGHHVAVISDTFGLVE